MESQLETGRNAQVLGRPRWIVGGSSKLATRIAVVVVLGYLAITKSGKALIETLAGRPRMGIAVLKGAFEGFVRKI